VGLAYLLLEVSPNMRQYYPEVVATGQKFWATTHPDINRIKRDDILIYVFMIENYF
jgi:hypothetical protein